MCAAYCMRACVWLMPSIRTLFRFTLEWKLPMFVRVCSNTVSRTGTENHEPTRTMVKKKNTHTRARTHTPLLGYFTRIMVAITRGAFIGCSHIPASLSYSKKKKEKKLLFSILCFFFSSFFPLQPLFLSCSFSSRWENWCERRTQDCGSAILTFQSRVSPGERK